MDRSDIAEAIAPLADALNADGAGLHLEAIDGSVVELRLSVTDATCAECVMPREVLEELLLDAIVSAGHPAERVRLEDPRGGSPDEASRSGTGQG